MKNRLLLFTSFLLLMSQMVTAQTWNYDYPSNSLLRQFSGSNITDDGYYIFMDKNNIIELSDYGELAYWNYSPNIGGSFSATSFIHKQANNYLYININGSPANSQIEVGQVDFKGDLDWQILVPVNGNNYFKRTPTAALLPNSQDIFMASVDSAYLISTSGNIIWRKDITNNSSIYVGSAATANELAVVSRGGEFFRLDHNGSILHQLQLNIEAKRLCSTPSHYIVVGEYNSNATLIFIDKINNNITTQTYGNGTISDMKKTYDGYILGGDDGQKPFLIKTDATGVQQWKNFYNGTKLHNIELSHYGGFVCKTDVGIFKTDRNGNTPNTPLLLRRGFGSINIGNISTIFNASGSMFWDYSDGHFHFPKDSATSTIFGGGLWVGGFDGGNLKMAAETYRSNNKQDFWSGYYGVDRDLSEILYKVWKIKRSELRDFQNDIADGTANRPIPHDILTWPAIGNPYFKGRVDSALVLNRHLADFVDVNFDGVYNAYDGDYPVMKGDEMLWWVFNDNVDIHTNTQGDPLKAEIIAQAYGYDCGGNEDIYNTLFLDLKIVNQSSVTLDSLAVGLWTDFDLGCFIDDNIGSDSISNTFYAYNDGAIDGAGGCGGTASYGEDVPIQSVTFLNHTMDNFMYYVNGGWVPGTGAPTVASQFYNILNSKWRDGTPLYNSSTGYQIGGATTNYAFPSNPSSSTGWSMCSANLPGANMRVVGSTGGHTLQPGQYMTLNMAYTVHENIPLPCPDISTDVSSNISNLQNILSTNTLDWMPNLGNDRTIDVNSTLTLNPNYNGSAYLWSDGSSNSTLDVTTPGIYSVTITDANGCQKTDEVDIIAFTNTNAIEEPQYDVNILPNPNSGIFNIQTKAFPTGDWTFKIYNITGQLMQIEQRTILEATGSISVVLPNVGAGMYLLRMENKEGVVITRKFIVND